MDNKFQLLDQKLKLIGSKDEQLREQTFEFWHLSRINNQFDNDQYKYLLTQSLKLIMYNIKFDANYSVLTRSYSLLLIDCLLQADNDYCIYSSAEIQMIIKQLVIYMKQEKNFSGYQQGIGWIHTLAHLSDCIYSLAISPKATNSQKQELLNAFLGLIDSNSSIYSFREDERIARALNAFSIDFDIQILSWFKTRKEYLLTINVEEEQKQLLVSKYRQVVKALFKYDKHRDELLVLLDTLYC